MADAKKPTDHLNSLLTFLALIGVCVWIGAIVASKGEERLTQACKPVEFVTQMVHQMTYAVIGSQPTWTLYMQGYLMTGCYYFFSVVFADKGALQGDLAKGNVRGSDSLQ